MTRAQWQEANRWRRRAARTLREANPDLEAVSASLMRRMGATGMCAVLIEHDGKITEVDPWV